MRSLGRRANPPAQSMSRAISPAEVALHNSERDCWIIVNGKVYDVTKYLNDHPGGVDIVTELAGKDSTEDYNDVGHTGDADEILATLQIGVLSTSAPAPSQQAAAAKPVAAAAPAPAPAKPVAAAAPAQTKAPSQAPKPKAQPEADNSMLILGGAAVALAAAAFFLLKKSKE